VCYNRIIACLRWAKNIIGGNTMSRRKKWKKGRSHSGHVDIRPIVDAKEKTGDRQDAELCLQSNYSEPRRQLAVAKTTEGWPAHDLPRVGDHKGTYAWSANKLAKSVKDKIASSVAEAKTEPACQVLRSFCFKLCQYFLWVAPFRNSGLWKWLHERTAELNAYELSGDATKRLEILAAETQAKALQFLGVD